MMIKRGNSIIVPNGRLELQKGDVLLTIAQEENTDNATSMPSWHG